MDGLKAMKAELEMMREEKTCMEARLIAMESAREENKRVLSEYKAMAKLADDLQDYVIKAEGDNLPENTDQNLDEEIMKCLIEEAMRDFTEVLNGAQTHGSRPDVGGNIGGGHEGSSGDRNLDVMNEALGSDDGRKGGAADGGRDDK